MEHRDIMRLEWRSYMQLHLNNLEFEELIELTSQKITIPSSAVRKDYFITMILEKLSDSDFLEMVVFKGGTSLSKCYPKSIERFSEDIDLTYIPEEGLTNKQIGKKLKNIEKILIGEGKSEIINEERNDRNKSCYVWFNDNYKEDEKIKLEIGSSVRPHPFGKKRLKSYIQEFLESIGEFDSVKEYNLKDIEVNVLNIERTFIDKILSVKRHAICETLHGKVRHIYDVVQLYKMDEIKKFLEDKENLKVIIKLTKETDTSYLEKRDIPKDYNPLGNYGFDIWKNKFNDEIKANYESLHKTLLYSNERQNWEEVEKVFEAIDRTLKMIDE